MRLQITGLEHVPTNPTPEQERGAEAAIQARPPKPPQAVPGKDEVFEAVALRPGVYSPGLGPRAGQRILFTTEVLRLMAPSMRGKPVNLEHQQTIDAEVGYVEDAWIGQEGELRVRMVLQQGRKAFRDAIAFITSRLDASIVPEVSVEIMNETFATAPESVPADLVQQGGTFAGIAILPNGACGAEDGCGIGLKAAPEYVSCYEAITVTDPMGHDPAPDAGTSSEDSEMSHDNDGACSCGGSLKEKLNSLTGEVDQLKAALAEREAAMEQLKNDHSAATEQVEAYQAAEREAKLDALEQAMPGEDVRSEFAEASMDAIDAALRVAKRSKAGFKPRDQDAPKAPRDKISGNADAMNLYRALREKMGITGDKTPDFLRRQTVEVLGNE